MNGPPSPELFARLTRDERERLEFLREQFRRQALRTFMVLPRLLMFASFLVGSFIPAVIVLLWTDQILTARVALAGLLLDGAAQILLVWIYGRVSFGRVDRVHGAASCYSNYVVSLCRKYNAGG